MRLQSMEDDLAGIKQVDVSYKQQKMVVKFDESIITIAQIITAVENLGYTAQQLSP